MRVSKALGLLARSAGAVALAVALVVFAFVVYLAVRGFPPSWKGRLLRDLNSGEFVVMADSAYLNVFEGVVARRLRVYRKGVVGLPLLESDEVVLGNTVMDTGRGGRNLYRIRVKHATFRPQMFGPPRSAGPSPAGVVEVKAETASIEWRFIDPLTVSVAGIDAKVGALTVGGRGVLRLAPPGAPAPSSPFGLSGGGMLVRAAREFNAVRWTGYARLDATFDVDMANPGQSRVALITEGDDAEWESFRIGRWRARAEAIGNRGSAAFAVSDSTLHGLDARDLSFRLQFDGDKVRLRELLCATRDGGMPGEVRAEVDLDRATGGFVGRWNSRCVPGAITPLFRDRWGRLAEFLDTFGFLSAPPEVRAEIDGSIGPERRLAVRADVRGTNMTYRGVAASLASAHLVYDLSPTRSTLALDRLVAEREDGAVEAAFTNDFTAGTMYLRLTCSADAKDMAKAAGPAVEKALAAFSFPGAERCEIEGVVGFRDPQATDLRISGSASRVGLVGLVAEDVAVDLRVVGKETRVSDAHGTLYGGPFKGTAVFRPAEESADLSRYRIGGEAAGVNLAHLMSALKGQETRISRGKLSATAEVEGLIGIGQGRTATGKGTLRLSQGHLFEIPLFGGLTGFLSKSVPGVRFLVEQTDAKASFAVRDGRVRSDDIRVEGGLFTLLAEGDYHLDERLDFAVRIKLLRDYTFVGQVLNLVTYPVGKLLEFHLEGTLRSPRWSLAILPE